MIECTPLSYAVQLASINVIRLMLDRGGDVCRGQLLQYCVFRENNVNNVLSLLIDKGAPLNRPMSEDRLTLMRFWPLSLGTALHVAVQLGKIDVISHLMKLGADMHVKDANARNALEFAQFCNQKDAAGYLEDWSQTH